MRKNILSLVVKTLRVFSSILIRKLTYTYVKSIVLNITYLKDDKTWGCMFVTSIKLVTRSSKFCDDIGIVIHKYKIK